MSALFSPWTIGPLSLPNRIVVAPMCQYSAEDGRATDWHLLHLGHLALSGAGLLITEATAVLPEGRISPADLGLYDEATERALQPVVRAIRRHSPIRLGIQLAHAGRKASSQVPWEGGQLIPADQPGGWRPVAPSPVPLSAAEPAPLELDEAGLERVAAGFVEAARRAARLGFDLIELHGAHGYLLHEFLSPLTNRRQDRYGGPLGNRLRFPLEVFAAVRAAAPGLAVGIRVSATDWIEGGWDPEQTIAFARELQKLGCDYIHVSSGGLSKQQKIAVHPNYQVPFAARVKAETGLPTVAVGMITEAEQAEAIVATGQADAVALARAMLYDPRWPWHAAAKLGAQVRAPQQYWRSQPRGLKDLFGDTAMGQR
ncbi:MAG TPA: NADH:flavin oxidoreductase/NADH oxidase [Nevskia sp.]|nr:NADH:flavin oxidoreductase/NADH oxidase [Nevskia sp.]